MDLHHVHLFANDIDKTLTWWRDILSAQIIFDGSLSGTRNVFVAVGTGRIHFYSQPPRGSGPSAVHHRNPGSRRLGECRCNERCGGDGRHE